ncbi:hypothetical protein ACWV27_19315 [Massilia varians]
MKKLMLAALASTLLGGCAHQSSTPRESRAQDDDYVSVGSNIPRKKSAGASPVSTASAAEIENDRMSGK